MCEINPKRSAFFRLEFFTSSDEMTDERWHQLVHGVLLALENGFNRSGEIRVHIHEEENDGRDSANP